MLDGYNPDDIFNADETSLFYKCLPDKKLAFKKERCYEGKQTKERVTCLLCLNMSRTENLPIFLIGKSAKPRDFRGIKSLPLNGCNNKKAWMTSQLFEDG